MIASDIETPDLEWLHAVGDENAIDLADRLDPREALRPALRSDLLDDVELSVRPELVAEALEDISEIDPVAGEAAIELADLTALRREVDYHRRQLGAGFDVRSRDHAATSACLDARRQEAQCVLP